MNFDLHPACYKAILTPFGPAQSNDDCYSNVGLYMMLAWIMWIIMLSGSSVGLHAPNHLWWIAQAFASHLMTNLAAYFAATVSAMAGFGTLYELCEIFENTRFKTYRLRKGTGIRKQCLRQFRREHNRHCYSPRSGRNSRMKVPEARLHLESPHHVRNITRPNRRVSPTSLKCFDTKPWKNLIQVELKHLKHEQARRRTSKSTRSYKPSRESFDLEGVTMQNLYDQVSALPKGSHRGHRVHVHTMNQEERKARKLHRVKVKKQKEVLKQLLHRVKNMNKLNRKARADSSKTNDMQETPGNSFLIKMPRRPIRVKWPSNKTPVYIAIATSTTPRGASRIPKDADTTHASPKRRKALPCSIPSKRLAPPFAA